MSYNLNKPIQWAAFKKMPKDLQEQYIIKLQNEFGVTCIMIAEMMGNAPLTIRRYVQSHGLNVKFNSNIRMNDAKREAWGRFISGDFKPAAEAVEVPAEESTETPESCACPVPQVNTTAPMSMTSMTLKFSGALDIHQIATSLKLILGNNSVGDLEIVCNLRT